ncbi:MAG: peptide permease [Paenibacillaceae bacterium]|nr:peptide permease [Paenibacillaceae bacterium]
MKMKQGAAGLVTSAMLVTLLLSACSQSEPAASGGTGGGTAAGSEADMSKRIKVSAMTISYGATPPDKSSGIKILEDKYNMDYTFIPIASTDYINKLGVTIASGDIPDLVVMPGLDQNWYNYMDNGVFLPLEKYINEKDTPNLAKLDKDFLSLFSGNGHLYGLPRLRSQASLNLTIRKDWLDKLSLPVPSTYDELYAAMKQFVEKDPDGNGKNDTYGMGFYVGTLAFGGTTSLFGSYKTPFNVNWSEAADGKIYPVMAHPNYRQSLEYLAKAYKDGIISKDFVIMKGTQAEDDFLTGKSGVWGDFAWNAYSQDRLDKARAVNPKFEWLPIPPLKGAPDGLQGYARGQGFNGFISIPAALGKDEAKVKRMLKFIDDQMGEDMNSELYKLLNYGKEGEHYQVVDGKTSYKDLGVKERPGLYLISNPPAEATGLNNPIESKEVQAVKNASFAAATAGAAFPDAMLGLVPTEMLKDKGGELNKLLLEASVKVISGEEPLTFYDKTLEEWKTKGGRQIVDEMNAAYKTLHGK